MKKSIWTKLGLGAGLCLTLMAGGCPESTRQVESKAAESNQANLISKYPVPNLTNSLERANLIERSKRINEQNMTGCIYLISYGSVMAFYPVNGKVSSLNSYLLSSEKLLSVSSGTTIEQADIDGAYGENADGVFFFTADTNSYVEWKGEYLWSDQCLALAQQPKLVRELTADQ